VSIGITHDLHLIVNPKKQRTVADITKFASVYSPIQDAKDKNFIIYVSNE